MQNDKPIIRHCMNCKYFITSGYRTYDCDVRYREVLYKRFRALICRYYKQKEV